MERRKFTRELKLEAVRLIKERGVEAMLAGRQPVSLTAKRLTRIGELPHGWEAQREMLGFDAINRP